MDILGLVGCIITKEAKNYYNYLPLNDCPPTIYETFQDVRRFIKFIYSEEATKFCEIFALLLTGTT